MSIQAYRVVPADSQQIPRARCYSGHLVTQPHMLSRTGLSPSTAGHSKPLPLAHMTGRLTVRPVEQDPTTPTTQPLTGITRNRFSQSSTFVRHYSRNHYCFLFLRVLRCFTSPRNHQPDYEFIWRRPPITTARFPHSDTLGSTLSWQLPEAFRSLSRPSSAS